MFAMFICSHFLNDGNMHRIKCRKYSSILSVLFSQHISSKVCYVYRNVIYFALEHLRFRYLFQPLAVGNIEVAKSVRFNIRMLYAIICFTTVIAKYLAQPEYTTPGGILSTNCLKGCTEVVVHESNCCKYYFYKHIYLHYLLLLGITCKRFK